MPAPRSTAASTESRLDAASSRMSLSVTPTAAVGQHGDYTEDVPDARVALAVRVPEGEGGVAHQQGAAGHPHRRDHLPAGLQLLSAVLLRHLVHAHGARPALVPAPASRRRPRSCGSCSPGPSDWLQGAVVSAFPEGATLTADTVTVLARDAQVPLNSDALRADQATLQRMKQQLLESLSGVPTIGSVTISNNQIEQDIPELEPLPDPPSRFARARSCATACSGTCRHPRTPSYPVDGLSDAIASLVADGRHAGRRPDDGRRALRRRSRLQRAMGDDPVALDDSQRPHRTVHRHGRLRLERSRRRSGGAPRVRARRLGERRGHELARRRPRIVALRLSRDGTRLIAELESEGRSRFVAAAIIRGDGERRPGAGEARHLDPAALGGRPAPRRLVGRRPHRRVAHPARPTAPPRSSRSRSADPSRAIDGPRTPRTSRAATPCATCGCCSRTAPSSSGRASAGNRASTTCRCSRRSRASDSLAVLPDAGWRIRSPRRSYRSCRPTLPEPESGADGSPAASVLAVSEALRDALALVLPVECSGCGEPGRVLCAACRRLHRRRGASGRPRRHVRALRPRLRRRRRGGVIAAFKDGGRPTLAGALGPALLAAVLAAVAAAAPAPARARRARGVARRPRHRDRRRAVVTFGLSSTRLQPGRRPAPCRRTAGRAGCCASRESTPIRPGSGVRRAERTSPAASSCVAGAARTRHPLAGRRFVIVDDILTTGSTMLRGGGCRQSRRGRASSARRARRDPAARSSRVVVVPV